VAAAAEEQAWDFGIAGSPPNIVAGFKDILTIGINNDEGAANEIIGAPGVTEWPPSELTPGMFTTTASSTGDLLMRLCLDAAGVDYDVDEHFASGSQGGIIDALETENTTHGALWAPNAYTYLSDNPDAISFCSGETIGFPILGGLMVRKEWAEANNDIVAKVLAAYLRGVTTMKNKNERDTVLAVSRSFYDDFLGVSIALEDMQKDLLLRPMFNLDDQLTLLDRHVLNDNKSQADTYYARLAQFMYEQGVIDSAIAPTTYITDYYMKLVSQNQDLRWYICLPWCL
jgi:NitT/TauT family transport system substrate-binding protein